MPKLELNILKSKVALKKNSGYEVHVIKNPIPYGVFGWVATFRDESEAVLYAQDLLNIRDGVVTEVRYGGSTIRTFGGE